MSEDAADSRDDIAEVRWAAPVRQQDVRRLYEMDARGIYDEDIIENVGLALYLRCRSILQVTEAHDWGRVRCPRCASGGTETVIQRQGTGMEEALACPACGWRVTWGQYHKTYQGRALTGSNALDVVQAFIPAYDAARSAREKVIAIDRLIHTFHAQMAAKPTAPAARNLIEGRMSDVVAFLNDLTYGPNNSPEVSAMRRQCEDTLARSMVAEAGENRVQVNGEFRKPPKQRAGETDL